MSEISEKKITDFLEFACKSTNFELSDREKKYYLAKLESRMTAKQVMQALDDLIEKSKKPTLANILSYEKGGYDLPEIAYSKAISGMAGEEQSCLMNDCIAASWGVASTLYGQGMKYEANRAFLATYEQSVIDAKARGEAKPRWWFSLGTDKEERERFIADSVKEGVISIEQAKVYLPHFTNEEISDCTQLQLDNKVVSIKRLESNAESLNLSDEEKKRADDTIKNLKRILAC